jgi:hypothetical protein
MSALSIQPTFPVFTDIDGQPLEAGYIFIGTANLNPITNPINVFFDAALTQPAVQPIRTIAGYPSNAGTPARLYVNSDYSIQVQNKNGTLVYSAPAATERFGNLINASQVVYDPAGLSAVPTTVQDKLQQYVSPEDFGADPNGVIDSTAAINAALAAHDCVIGTGTYLASSSIIVSGISKKLKLKNLNISAPVIFEDGFDCIFEVDNFGVTNSFPIGGNMLENGTSGDTGRSYNFNAIINYVTGSSPDTVVRAHVVRNHRCTFSTWNILRSFNTKNVYTCIPDVALGDNKVCGNLLENCDYGMYVWGQGSTKHVEHHMLQYNFIAGAKYGALYARQNAHYVYMEGAFDFNGQGLIRLNLASAPTVAVDDPITGSVTGATGVVSAIEGNSILVIKGTGTFTTADSIGGVAVSSLTNYQAGGPFLDFVSQTVGNFARHTIIASFLTDVFGNNQEDWMVIEAQGPSNKRASFAGHQFFASSGEQYIALMKNIFSVRGPGNVQVVESTPTTAALRTMNVGIVEVVAANGPTWTTADGSGNKLIEWNTTDGLELGQWTGAQIIKANRNVQFIGGNWDTPHIVLGTYHLWVDDSGLLRINNGQPTSTTDGTVVGTQT